MRCKLKFKDITIAEFETTLGYGPCIISSAKVIRHDLLPVDLKNISADFSIQLQIWLEMRVIPNRNEYFDKIMFDYFQLDESKFGRMYEWQYLAAFLNQSRSMFDVYSVTVCQTECYSPVYEDYNFNTLYFLKEHMPDYSCDFTIPSEKYTHCENGKIIQRINKFQKTGVLWLMQFYEKYRQGCPFFFQSVRIKENEHHMEVIYSDYDNSTITDVSWISIFQNNQNRKETLRKYMLDWDTNVSEEDIEYLNRNFLIGITSEKKLIILL